MVHRKGPVGTLYNFKILSKDRQMKNWFTGFGTEYLEYWQIVLYEMYMRSVSINERQYKRAKST